MVKYGFVNYCLFLKDVSYPVAAQKIYKYVRSIISTFLMMDSIFIVLDGYK
mgnify:CR=1 FL=1